MKINQSGRSMIEMLGVLAIIGVLSVGGIAGYSKAMNKYRMNKINDQVSMIVANVRTLYAMQRDYASLDTVGAKQMGAIPDDMFENADAAITSTAGKVTNPYNGEVRVSVASLSAANDNKAFIITYDGLPRDACVAIATNDWGSSNASGLVAIRAKSVSDFADDTGNMLLNCDGKAENAGGEAIACPGVIADNKVRTPLPVASAAKACNCGTNVCSVTWKYY